MATKKTTENKDVESNVLVLSNGKKLTIRPTKLKYFKTGDFNMYRVFEKYGLQDTIIESNGVFTKQFLSAVLDKPYTKKDVKTEDKNENDDYIYLESYEFDKEIDLLFDEEMTLVEFEKLVEIALKVNGITPN